jgi:hypothetical protein
MLKETVINRRMKKQSGKWKITNNCPTSAGKSVTKHDNNSGSKKDMQECCSPEIFFQMEVKCP